MCSPQMWQSVLCQGLVHFDYGGVDFVFLQRRFCFVQVLPVAVWPEPDSVPDAVVGQRCGLNLRFEPGERETSLQVVRVGRALERTRLQVIHHARGRARRRRLAELLPRDRLLAGKDLVEIKTRLALGRFTALWSS